MEKNIWWCKILEKNKKSIYVFTSITEDALTLAHSIEEHHLDKKEKCIIIFSGNIGAFDKLNPLCVEIFSSGYIYNSVNVNNNHKTVLEILKLKAGTVSPYAISEFAKPTGAFLVLGVCVAAFTAIKESIESKKAAKAKAARAA